MWTAIHCPRGASPTENHLGRERVILQKSFHWSTSIAVFVSTFLLCGTASSQSNSETRPSRGKAAVRISNPLEGIPEAIRAGDAAYHARCAKCHGTDARGTVSGSNLTSVWRDGGTDQQLFQYVRRGLPNTLLPHSFGPDDEVWNILAYLHPLEDREADRQTGDIELGKKIFDQYCSTCHQVNGHGGRLGPDLSRVASTRLRPLLEQKIRHASSYIMSVYQGGAITEGYQPVVLVTGDGREIRGAKKNEDAFSIQIMDVTERLQGYRKTDLKSFEDATKSLMPDFGPDRISDQEVNNLLAYLETLQGKNSVKP
jgi:putative heme-binding domain-containing protein